MVKTGTLLFCCFFIAILASAQEQIGLNPPSLKWRQIDAPAGRIIFPEGLDSAAYRAAGIMAWQRKHDGSLVGTGRTKRIPTILQNQSAMPAGFSTPAPWRNEFYLTPPQNLFTGPTTWLTYLTVHEYRHSQQFHLANQGAALPFKILMGQTGWLLNALVNQPLWFREGDAVVTETALTNAGRGSVPRFHIETRAIMVENFRFRYNYEKLNFPASFRDFIPNPYRIGYYMTSKARREYGNDIWQKVMHDTHHTFPVYPLTRSLKKNTGLGAAGLFRETMQELDSLWQQTDKNLNLTPATVLTRPGRTNYTNYRFPHYLPDSTLIVLKDGFDEIRTFYKIHPDGREEKLFPYGVYTEDHLMFAAAGDLISWAESSFDERWVNQDYSVIKTYNTGTGKTKKITSRTRYFAPAPSPDSSRIIAVHSDKAGRNSLVMLEAATGQLMQEWPSPENAFPAQPRWEAESKSVVYIEVTENGNRLSSLNTETGQFTALMPFTNVPLSRPFPFGDHIYFSGGYTGIDNIYALHRPSGKVFQVTSVRFGAFEPTLSADGQKLLYSSYTAQGYRLEETAITPETWTELPAAPVSDIRFQEQLPAAAENLNLAARNFPTGYQVRKYRALTDGLFNFYGWFPTIGADQYGLDLYTRNLMSTLRGTVGLFYNTNENALGSKVNLAYAAFYPILELESGYHTRKKAKIRDASEINVSEQEWSEKYVSAGVRLPFRLTQGKYFTNLEIGGALGHYNISFLDSINQDQVTETSAFNSYSTTFTFSRLLLRARQQVQPRWGQTARFHYQKALNAKPERMVAEGSLFFPGFRPTHSFNVRGAWKKEEIQQTYRFLDNFVMPRGYRPYPYRQISVASLNYELPLWYPDVALGPVAFLQRFRTNLFAEASSFKLTNMHAATTRFGADLLVDVRFLRLFSTTMVFRYSYGPNKGVQEVMPFQFLITRFELAN